MRTLTPTVHTSIHKHAQNHQRELRTLSKVPTNMHRLLTVSSILFSSAVHSFVPVSQGRFDLSSLSMVVDPISSFASLDTLAASFAGSITEVEVGAALVGAAAGAMSQLPRIQHLQGDLQAAHDMLNATETALSAKIVVLEDKLFAMDQEYEEQTARFKRQYDATQREEIEQLKDKLKTEMQYKLEIKLAEQQSQRLGEKVVEEHSRTGRQGELSNLRLKQERLATMNAELEDALQKSDTELQKIRGAVKRKRFLIF